MTGLNPGDQITAKISRISSSGRGIIELKDRYGHLNVGPVTKDSVDERVTAIIVQPENEDKKVFDRKRIHAPSIEEPIFGYLHNTGKKKPNISIPDGGGPYTLSQKDESGDVDFDLRGINYCDDCGSLMSKQEGKWNCTNCDFTDDKEDRSAVDRVLDRTPLPEIPEEGKEFTAEVDRISGNGNGVIVGKRKQINIGPVFEGIVGNEITATKLGGSFARCETKKFRKDNYMESLREIVPPDVSVDITSKTADDEPRETEDNKKDRQQVDRDFPSGEAKSKSRSDKKDQAELQQLREAAEESAVENVPEGSTTSTIAETPEYTRSTAVRKYVLARANGVCEGCESPAPFANKSGNPYLHTHHVNELSDGGSDTPETVIALCPNCHYRVHHGEGGEEYNKDLIRKLNNIENISE